MQPGGPNGYVAQVRGLAELLRLSRKTVVYTGAGISAAVRFQGSPPPLWMRDGAHPRMTHRACSLHLLGGSHLLALGR